jgi:Calpain family cysteine protease
MFEKAWAKVKGNYALSNGGFIDEGIRAITGSPGFNYKTEFVYNSSFWQMLYDSYQSNYILLASTP